jgi:hypothetical protein
MLALCDDGRRRAIEQQQQQSPPCFILFFLTIKDMPSSDGMLIQSRRRL